MSRKRGWSAAVAMMVLAGALAVEGGSRVGRESVQPIPEPETEPHVGEMKVRRLNAMRYIFREEKTSFATLGEAVAKMLAPLDADVLAGKVPAGPYIFCYDGVGLGDQFTLRIGMAVRPEFKVPEGYKVVDEPEYLCAAVLYTGPVSGLGQTWTELGNGIGAEGYITTHSGREYYLYFESMESPNNVVMLASGIKP